MSAPDPLADSETPFGAATTEPIITKASHPGHGYLIAAWTTLGVAGAILLLYIAIFAILTLVQGWFWLIIGFLAGFSLLGVLVCVGLVALGFFSLARGRRLGRVKGQALTVTVTFIGFPLLLGGIAAVAGIGKPTDTDALIAVLLAIAFGLVIFCAAWSLWGPRVAPTGQAPTAA